MKPTAPDEVEVLPPERPGFGGATRLPGGGGLQPHHLSHLVSYLMDNLIKVPGTRTARFGINPFLDIIPGIGDSAAVLIQALTLVEGARRQVPKVILTRMFLNVLLNGFMGMIPGVGEAFAFWFKPTSRNYNLLMKHAPLGGSEAAPVDKSTSGDWAFVVFLLIVMFAIMAVFIAAGLWVIGWLAHQLFTYSR